MRSDSEQAAHRFAEAVTRGDREAGVAVTHPEIEFDSVLGISGRAYVGHDGNRHYFDDVASAWREWAVRDGLLLRNQRYRRPEQVLEDPGLSSA